MTAPDAKPVSHHPGAGPIAGLAFSPDGRRLAWSGFDGSVRVRDVRTNKDLMSFRGHFGVVNAVAFSPDGRTLATAITDRTVRLWDVTGEQEPSYNLGGANVVISALLFLPEDRLIATGGMRNTAYVWDIRTRKPLLSLPAAGARITGAVASRDQRFFAWVSDGVKLQVHDVEARRPAYDVDLPGGLVSGIAFSNDDREIAWGGADGVVHFCDAVTGRELGTLGPQTGGITGVAYHPNGKLLATVSRDMTFHVWDLATKAEVARFGGPGRELAPLADDVERPAAMAFDVTRLAFSPDGRRLAAANMRRPLELWDMTTHRLALTLDWAGASVQGAGWSPDGRYLAMARSNSVKVLDSAEQPPEARRAAAADGAAGWHKANAAQSIKEKKWFAADFHLGHVITAEPDVAGHHERRARARGELEDWDGAFHDNAKVLDLGSRNLLTWYNQACLALQRGDHEAYRAHCASALKLLEGSVTDKTANELVWMCLLAPGATADPQRLVKLAGRAPAAFPEVAAYRNTLGTALYRSGKHVPAISQLLHGLNLPEANGGTPHDWAVLAMAYARLGDAVQARAWFAKLATAPEPATWQLRLERRLLEHEAAAEVARLEPAP